MKNVCVLIKYAIAFFLFRIYSNEDYDNSLLCQKKESRNYVEIDAIGGDLHDFRLAFYLIRVHNLFFIFSTIFLRTHTHTKYRNYCIFFLCDKFANLNVEISDNQYNDNISVRIEIFLEGRTNIVFFTGV